MNFQSPSSVLTLENMILSLYETPNTVILEFSMDL